MINGTGIKDAIKMGNAGRTLKASNIGFRISKNFFLSFRYRIPIEWAARGFLSGWPIIIIRSFIKAGLIDVLIRKTRNCIIGIIRKIMIRHWVKNL